jgi:methionine-rich copper-binding protein CopC
VSYALRVGMAAFAILAALGSLSGVAFAHALYQSSTPANGAILAAAPATVRIVFTEGFVPAQSSATVSGPDGSKADNGDAKADPADADRATMMLTLKPGLGNGVYTVNWNTVSADDGDAANGAFAFRVGPGASPALPITGDDLTLGMAALGLLGVVSGGALRLGWTRRRAHVA